MCGGIPRRNTRSQKADLGEYRIVTDQEAAAASHDPNSERGAETLVWYAVQTNKIEPLLDQDKLELLAYEAQTGVRSWSETLMLIFGAVKTATVLSSVMGDQVLSFNDLEEDDQDQVLDEMLVRATAEANRINPRFTQGGFDQLIEAAENEEITWKEAVAVLAAVIDASGVLKNKPDENVISLDQGQFIL